ncbi:DUF4382 domain-containing protein [Solimonas fluminis]|nr:DUF4382 domain-containing protein [Solimonas fluminis]
MPSYKNPRALPAAVVLAAALAACGGGGGSGDTGTVNLGVTDAPVDSATAVVVEFSGVEAKPQGGRALSFDFPAPRQIDLLALQGGDSALLLEGVVLPAGPYEWLRLKVNAGREASDSYIDLDDGSRHALFIPSGNQSGLKLNGGFTVAADTTSNFTIDFDLRKSVHNPAGLDGDYILRPSLRIVDDSKVGTLAGTVGAESLAAENCTPAVYVYSGAGVTPDDEGSAAAPLSSASLTLDAESGDYRYVVAYLPVGSYTVAFTCDAADDDPATEDVLAFSAPADAVIVAGQTTTVDFP